MGVIVYDPAKPLQEVNKGKLLMYKDSSFFSTHEPKNVGELLMEIRKLWEGKKLEKDMFIIDLWGGTLIGQGGAAAWFTFGRFNIDINYANVKEKLPERKLFYTSDIIYGLCSVPDWHDGGVGLTEYITILSCEVRNHRYCNTNLRYQKFCHYSFLRLPHEEPTVEYGYIEYMNPWGMWEFYHAFVIGKQWRRRKADRPLELLERVTSESDELVLTVGIPIIALSRNPNNPRDARYVAEMLRSYVVYWAFNSNPSQWVRVAVLNKEAKVDFHKAYFTVQLVLIRDFIYEDNRVIYNQENGTA